MSPKRMFFVMVGVVSLVGVFILAGAYFGNSMLQKKADKLIELKLDNRTLEEQQTSLTQAKKDVAKYSDLDRIARTIVPQEKDQARTVRELVNIANASGIKIASIAFPSSNLGQAVPKPVASTSGGNTTTPVTTTPSISQVKPVENIQGVYQLEITMQSDSSTPVSYDKLISFLNRLEQNRRTAQVTNLIVQPKSNGLITFNLVVNVYIKP